MSALLEKESHLHEHELGIPEGMILTGEKAKCHLVSQKCRMDCLVIGHLLLGRKPGPYSPQPWGGLKHQFHA